MPQILEKIFHVYFVLRKKNYITGTRANIWYAIKVALDSISCVIVYTLHQ